MVRIERGARRHGQDVTRLRVEDHRAGRFWLPLRDDIVKRVLGVHLDYGVEREDDRLAMPWRGVRVFANFEDSAAGVLDEIPPAIAAAQQFVQALLDSSLAVPVDITQAHHLSGDGPLRIESAKFVAESPDVGWQLEAADPISLFISDAPFDPQKLSLGMRGNVLEES